MARALWCGRIALYHAIAGRVIPCNCGVNTQQLTRGLRCPPSQVPGWVGVTAVAVQWDPECVGALGAMCLPLPGARARTAGLVGPTG